MVMNFVIVIITACISDTTGYSIDLHFFSDLISDCSWKEGDKGTY